MTNEPPSLAWLPANGFDLFAIAANAHFPPSLPQQPSRNYLRLNFRCTLENVQDPRVTQDTTDFVFQREAVAAVNLQPVVGAGPGDAGG